ncbi:hypothetical protein ACIRS1_27480 [Kitasatospora sp. NPDC101176]|uniref:hypothetical protein n=1 Tax=Kitasatospora sp. NPDC101176 TaxID=3364099 RepID=UPI0038191C8B
MNITRMIHRKAVAVLGGAALTTLAVCGVAAAAQSPDNAAKPSGRSVTPLQTDKNGNLSYSHTVPKGDAAAKSGQANRPIQTGKDGKLTFTDSVAPATPVQK